MILSDALICYLRIIQNKPKDNSSYRLDDPIIQRYEILREYASSVYSSRKLNELANRYKITPKTIKNYLDTKHKSNILSLYQESFISNCDLVDLTLEKKNSDSKSRRIER